MTRNKQKFVVKRMNAGMSVNFVKVQAWLLCPGLRETLLAAATMYSAAVVQQLLLHVPDRARGCGDGDRSLPARQDGTRREGSAFASRSARLAADRLER